MIWRVLSVEESFVFYPDGIVLKKGTKVRKKGIKNEKETKQERDRGRENDKREEGWMLLYSNPNTQAYILR